MAVDAIRGRCPHCEAAVRVRIATVRDRPFTCPECGASLRVDSARIVSNEPEPDPPGGWRPALTITAAAAVVAVAGAGVWFSVGDRPATPAATPPLVLVEPAAGPEGKGDAAETSAGGELAPAGPADPVVVAASQPLDPILAESRPPERPTQESAAGGEQPTDVDGQNSTDAGAPPLLLAGGPVEVPVANLARDRTIEALNAPLRRVTADRVEAADLIRDLVDLTRRRVAAGAATVEGVVSLDRRDVTPADLLREVLAERGLVYVVTAAGDVRIVAE